MIELLREMVSDAFGSDPAVAVYARLAVLWACVVTLGCAGLLVREIYLKRKQRKK